MTPRLATLLACSAVWTLGACSEAATDVELRLYPCMLAGGAPTSVELEIRNLDAKGAEVGALLSKTFMLGDPGIFSDGYATVGYRPPTGTVTADIKVTWTGAGETVVATYGVPVPALGESVSLGVDQCEGGPGTTGMPTTTVDPTSGSVTDGTATTETGTGTTTGTTESTSTDTGTGTTDVTTGTTTGTTDTTTDTTMGTTGDDPMEGGDCPGQEGALVCTGAPGTLGEVLFCEGGMWVLKNDICTADACIGLGFNNPQIVGCLGQGAEWSCACAETPQGECDMGMQSQCGGPVGDGVLVELCVMDGGNTWHYAAQCPVCDTVNGQPLCML